MSAPGLALLSAEREALPTKWLRRANMAVVARSKWAKCVWRLSRGGQGAFHRSTIRLGNSNGSKITLQEDVKRSLRNMYKT